MQFIHHQTDIFAVNTVNSYLLKPLHGLISHTIQVVDLGMIVENLWLRLEHI